MKKRTLLAALLVVPMGIAIAFNPPSGGLGYTGQGSTRSLLPPLTPEEQQQAREAFETPEGKEARELLGTSEAKSAIDRLMNAIP
jgi:hypothetical protein